MIVNLPFSLRTIAFSSPLQITQSLLKNSVLFSADCSFPIFFRIVITAIVDGEILGRGHKYGHSNVVSFEEYPAYFLISLGAFAWITILLFVRLVKVIIMQAE